VFALGIAVTALIPACASSSSPDSTSASLTRVNVAMVSITDGSTFFVALRHGFFRQAGLDVRYTITPQSTAAMPGLLNGSIDVIGAANYVSAFESQIHGPSLLRQTRHGGPG
jgi:ABC-type nitrate/sulfonate/bicarbonate transport system substrate-binding protein